MHGRSLLEKRIISGITSKQQHKELRKNLPQFFEYKGQRLYLYCDFTQLISINCSNKLLYFRQL